MYALQSSAPPIAIMHDASLAGEGEIGFTYDAEARRFHIHGEGFWTIAQVDTHFVELGDAVTRQRMSGVPIAAMVDLSKTPVQTPDVARRVQLGTLHTYRRGDRVAVLVGSALAKAQMRRVLDMQVCELFVSRRAAETWLNAYL